MSAGVVDLMVARDGVEPPTLAFSGLASPGRYLLILQDIALNAKQVHRAGQKMIFIPNWPMRGLCAPPGCRKFVACVPVAVSPSTQFRTSPELKLAPQE